MTGSVTGCQNIFLSSFEDIHPDRWGYRKNDTTSVLLVSKLDSSISANPGCTCHKIYHALMLFLIVVVANQIII